MQELNLDEKRVLSEVLNTSDPWRVAGEVRIPFPRFVNAVKALEKKKLIKTARGKITLTAKGKKLVREFRLVPRSAARRRIARARNRFIALARKRPTSISLYDQGYMTPESVFTRVEIISSLGDADGKRIAILGDDDLLSIALCLATQPLEVTVFEIDQRLVDYILDLADRNSLPINAYCHDLRNPLPSRFKGKFDVFVSDPSETIDGLKMFLGRGLFLLKPEAGKAGYFGLTAIEASYSKWAKTELWLLKNYSIAITHILPSTAYYYNWPDLLTQTAGFDLLCLKKEPKLNWFNSSLIRLETLDGFKPKDMGRITGPIFYDDESCGILREE